MTSIAAPSHAMVVMAHGDSPFLGDCLASLRAQTTAPSIVVATSTPSPFIGQAAQRIGAPVIVNPDAAGIGADFNFALVATPARRVTLAHQDDVYYPRFAERALALLDATPEAVACFTGYDEIDDAGAVKVSKISVVKHLLDRFTLGDQTVIGPRRLRGYLSLGNALPCSSVTFDRDRAPEFRFSPDYRSNLDWDAWLRLAENGSTLVRAPEALVGRRHNPLTATSRLIREGVRQREDLEMFRRLWPTPIAEGVAWLYRAGY